MKTLKKTLALITTLALSMAMGISAGVSAADAPTANTFDVNSTTVKLLGRSFTQDDYTCFSYGAAGVEIKFSGTDLWVDIAQLDGLNQSTDVMILVDTLMPMEATRYTITATTGWLQAAKGLSNGEHFVRIIKMSRGIGAGGSFGTDFFGIRKIAVNDGGSILTPNAYSDLVIEAYGDSITNGDAVWLNAEGSNQAYTYGAYSGVVSRLLGAELYATGNTGNGLNSWCLGAGNLFPPRESWDQMDIRANQEASVDHSNTDVLIINLGTNDMAAIGNTTDAECEQYTEEYFKESYISWLEDAYKANPNIICIGTLGAMGADLLFDDIQAACDYVNKKAGKEYAYFVELTKCTTFEGGAGYDNGHPSNYAHETYGLMFAKLINEKLGLGMEEKLNAYVPVRVGSPEINASNLALKATAYGKEGVAVYEDTAFAANTNDGNPATQWQYADSTGIYDADTKALTDCWIAYEFPEATELDKILITWEYDTRCSAYTIQTSEDGEEWADIKDAEFTYGEKQESGKSEDTIAFEAVTAKYYRINMTEGTSGKAYCPKIYEVEMYSANYNPPTQQTQPDNSVSSNTDEENQTSAAAESTESVSSQIEDQAAKSSAVIWIILAVAAVAAVVGVVVFLKSKK